MNRQEFENALAYGIKLFQVVDQDCTQSEVKNGEIVELRADDEEDNLPAFYYPNKEPRDRKWGECERATWDYMNIAGLEPFIPNRHTTTFAIEPQGEPINVSDEATDTNAHYITNGVQPIQFCQQFMTKEQFEGACMKDMVKYISRFGKKDDKVKEAKKIVDYALWLAMSTMNAEIDPMKHNHTEIFKALGVEA